MKKSQPWHHSRLGTIVLWLGSIELAVPVLVLTALALALGTYLDSTRGARLAMDVVYGSWWFISLMVLVCVSLVFAVVTRFPWKRRHIGFMIVHASLITLIAGGFWSMFGRIEGHLALEEGSSGNSIETAAERLELVEHLGGEFATLAAIEAPRRAGAFDLKDVRLQFVEKWENTRDEGVVTNDAPGPFRAVQISAQAGSAPVWVGEEERDGGASVLAGLRVRVLPDGAAWSPPSKEGPSAPGYFFVLGESRLPLAQPGQEAIPGWTIVSIKRFAKALVSGGGLTENPAGPDNPAIDVTISDGAGTTERHTAFLSFPDMVMNRTVEGPGRSGARLIATGGGNEPETLVVFGPIAPIGLGYIAPDGTSRVLETPASFPATLDLGQRRVTIVQQFARARGDSRTVKAPKAKDNRPALVLRSGDATELTVVPWKGLASVNAGGRDLLLRYGPGVVPLPFSVKLADFRKTDYPGTEMAMAYESDVFIALPGQPEAPYRIFMNNPYIHGPWRVYQSGFVGDNLSVFSVMRDPGLTMTYTGAAFLCVGIVIIFYSRSLSWGHPGIPVPFADQEKSHAKPVNAPSVNPLPNAAGQPVGA